ncbi:glycosyltransferase family protein [Pedobacter suwonensis]|uniref:hypothetical protein n=1 Tax=Pedobacter suwonensis TaxID=332999 RepID=UPI001AD84320|nr:hypothetical protein [Pedobacter suwonensis]
MYDNSPYIQQPTPESNVWDICYQSDLANGGLSIAYNTAAQYAKNNNKKYLMLLDQDTLFPENSLAVYLEGINSHPDIKLFAPIMRIQNGQIMSPCRYIYKWGKLIDHIVPRVDNLAVHVPVNSGLCIHLESYFDVGGYNEKVKIDGADFQFISRFQKKHQQFYILDLTLHQDFSMFEEDPDKIITRYKLFLKDVNNFETHHWLDRFYFYRIICIRTLKLTLQTRKLEIMRIFFKNLFQSNV